MPRSAFFLLLVLLDADSQRFASSRIQSQFDHLSESYFNNFEYDLGERELSYALAFDHDLEMFAASVGLIKTSVAAVLKDGGAYVSILTHFSC